MAENKLQVMRPFGPSVAKSIIPDDIVKKLNDYVDKVASNEEKSKQLDHGASLAGNVKQEIFLEKDIIESSGWGKFLENAVEAWIKYERKKQITKFDLIRSWVVRQFKNEYNPIHWHGGHISGAGYLKVPDTFGETFQPNKHNVNGRLELIHGNRAFMCSSKATITPKVGEMFFFPHYLMHAVSPFVGTDQERRSVSFNCYIDEDIFNVFNKK
tara:strand:- start:84 stop:722 length:639 start_codon:yes stop_codon:yes gene_type:complete